MQSFRLARCACNCTTQLAARMEQQSNISPPGRILDWNCRELIDTVAATSMTVYHAVRICCVIVSMIPAFPQTGSNVDTHFVWLVQGDIQQERWKIPSEVFNVASGSVDEGTKLGWIARAQAADEAGVNYRDTSLELVGVFESDISGVPILDVVVLLAVDGESDSVQDNPHTRTNVGVRGKAEVERMDEELFDPPVFKQCVLAAFAKVAELRARGLLTLLL